MLQKPRGTRDFLPAEMEARRAVECDLRDVARRWGYREVATPAFEELELFTIRSGDGIIQEMYAFSDKGGRSLALRPEITAPVLRMFVNEGRVMPKPLRWYYFADCFRYERPQKGRYRQFWQFGVELIGADTAMADAEVVILAHDLLCAAGVSFEMRIGHLAITKHLLEGVQSADQKPIMGFLDKKDVVGLEHFLHGIGRQDLFSSLISLRECRDLSDVTALIGRIPEQERLEEMFSLLEAAGVPYTLDAGIARGLDYYTGMVFEAFAEHLGAENQICGGGVYRLAHLFGGDDAPSAGFAIGFDRVMVARGERPPVPDVVVAVASTREGRTRAIEVSRAFRSEGIRTELDILDRGLSAQLASAARSARYAVIIGKRETESGDVTIRDLSSGEQKCIPLRDAVSEVADRAARR